MPRNTSQSTSALRRAARTLPVLLLTAFAACTSLTPTQRRILDVLKRRGSASAEELRDALWSDDPDGGPDNPSTLHAHVWHLNQRLKSRGLLVRASRYSGYRVIEIKDVR